MKNYVALTVYEFLTHCYLNLLGIPKSGESCYERMSAESYTAVLAYYAALAPAAGFQGRCAMSIPADIEGKRVLDVCCRKGKGAFALVNCLPFLMS